MLSIVSPIMVFVTPLSETATSLMTNANEVTYPLNTPRINFDASLVNSVLEGTKTATTRLDGEHDPTSDLASLTVGTQCRATS